MEIFCQRCQKRVGQVADEKIPVGRQASVKCPQCGERISLFRPAPAATPVSPTTGATASPPPPPPPSPGPVDSAPRQSAGEPPLSTTGAPPNYDFTIGAILKEAWQKTSGIKGPIWGAGFIFGLVLMLLMVTMAMVSRTLGLEAGGLALGSALQITFTVATYPFMAGVMMIGIRRSVGLPVNWKMAFGYFSSLLPIVIASFLTTVLSFIGFLLLLLPGLYLSVAYMLTIPLIVDKEYGPWQAMEASRQAIHQHWFKVFGLYLTMAGILGVSMLPFFLGVIWTLPMFIMVSSILYREIFGVSEQE